VSSIELTTLELERAGSAVIEIGRYVISLLGDRTGPVADRGKYLVLHRRQHDGRWGRSVEVFNPDRPPADATQRHDRKESP
jgi:ketosteroid isomerase-like protein